MAPSVLTHVFLRLIGLWLLWSVLDGWVTDASKAYWASATPGTGTAFMEFLPRGVRPSLWRWQPIYAAQELIRLALSVHLLIGGRTLAGWLSHGVAPRIGGCPKCGYPCAGLKNGTCPECGGPIGAPQSGGD